ncbi:MAG: MFS transporter [Bryobacteraceae bacterium]|nr:MFS transporter [Bryobacteraceae bacterium]
MTRARWSILALLFFATTINYLDRIVFSVLIPIIRQDLHISDEYYGYINGAFQAAYTVGYIFMGPFIDRVGTRIGYAVAITWWSIAAALHALSRSAFSLGFWRWMLGLGESGNFPAAIKSVAEWFPKKDRAFATGIFNAGSNVASMIGPPIIVWMVDHVGWRACFFITASLGFVWLLLWLLLYHLPERHPRVNRAELDFIQQDLASDPEQAKIGWAAALRHRETWGFALAKFLTDPVWWFYLFWLPPYLYDVRGFNLREIGWALPVVYLMADFGSVGGGWLPGFLMRRGWPHHKARKTTMAIFAATMPVAALAALATHPVLAIALISLATSSHQGWSANLFTTVSDVFPKNAVASVTSIGGTMGGLGGTIFASILPGIIVTYFGYTPVILGFGVFHLAALWVLRRLMGDMKRIAM